MTIQQQIIDKMNEGREIDSHFFTWDTIPKSLKTFWANYFQQKKQ